MGKKTPPISTHKSSPDRIERAYELSKGYYVKPITKYNKGEIKNKYAQGVKSPGRAQPKGTPPRTGPGSGSGGQSARYNRLTGGLMKHGR